ncbi:heterokaryon incompatibility protein-domain-containing protein [Lasiosphaeria ovina]|uniref:Heterokaryon incompatibility protein-domain-containing protein n=1 Tax=Lasiosphaeria ovina TaxID=92902 RepID=A0AAE0KGL2_9PEZI|nr:heterokaryon incompatibility protein-domain-containing protein [Lasiosphaeria ovina]
MLRGWLEVCDRHQDCRSSGDKVLPKRLVDIGDGANPTVKIISATEDHRYLALSHCWGFGKKPLSTIRANEASMRLEIPWEALPLSFQDAIRVTRWLDARYIWIDSLCILQDDDQDWQEESAKMAGIFSGCHLSIAASRASSCDEGFLQVRNEGRWVITSTYQGTPLVVFARDSTGHTVLKGVVPFPWFELPLFHRAWCFQERLLAPRTLHFARDELFFQCRTEDQCECSGRSAWKQSSTPESLLGRTAGAFVQRLYEPQGDVAEDQETPIRFGQLWGDVVSEYTSLNITYQQDVLPAISGIANLMLAHSPGRYFAGLWELDIHYLLAWNSDLEEGRCYRPQEYTAPSFSWASRFGQVFFSWQCRITRVCVVLDIRCEANGADPYGRLLPGGYIVLQGKLISGTIKSCLTDTTWRYSLTGWDPNMEDSPANPQFDTEEDEKDIQQGIETRVYYFDLFRETDWVDEEENGIGNEYAHSIVLRDGDEPGTFRRIGTAFDIPAVAFDCVPDVIVKIV